MYCPSLPHSYLLLYRHAPVPPLSPCMVPHYHVLYGPSLQRTIWSLTTTAAHQYLLFHAWSLTTAHQSLLSPLSPRTTHSSFSMYGPSLPRTHPSFISTYLPLLLAHLGGMRGLLLVLARRETSRRETNVEREPDREASCSPERPPALLRGPLLVLGRHLGIRINLFTRQRGLLLASLLRDRGLLPDREASCSSWEGGG